MAGFRPGIAMTLLVVLFLPILIGLGNWQLERGALKRELESAYLEQITRLPVRPSPAVLEQPFTTIRLSGRLLERRFLVDNQTHRGQIGYWVFQEFLDDESGTFLVNRGFVGASQFRDELPKADYPQEQLRLTATVWPQLGLTPLLAADPWAEGWPKRVQRADIVQMAAEIAAYPAELRLAVGQPGVEVAAPFAEQLSDSKHRGYALTWFGLAITLAIGYLVFGLKNAKLEIR